MSLSFWTTLASLGLGARIQPTGWTAPSGDFVLCLGSDVAGYTERLAPGAYLEIYQTNTFDDANVVRFASRTRGAESMPGDLAWKASLRIDDVDFAERIIEPGSLFDWNEFAFNVSQVAAGAHKLAFRLSLVDLGSTVIPDGGIEVEIPAWYFDALSFDTSIGSPILLNAVPEGGHDRISRTANVEFEIVDLGSDGIDLAETFVTLNGVPVYSAGVFQPGWAGPESATSTPQPNAKRFVIDPQNSFDSEQDITIEVHSKTNAGAPLVGSWTFYIVDETFPAVASANALTTTTVHVAFNEPMTSTTSTDPNDATNPENYTFEPLPADGIPAVTPTTASVEKLSSESFIVTASEAFTPGVAYSIIVANAQDANGNAIQAPNNSATFTFSLPVPNGRSFDLWRMIPQMNRQEDETGDLVRFIRCLQEPVDLALYDVDTFPQIIDLDIAPEPFVDQMLLDMGNPFAFAASLSLTDKRRLLRVLPTLIGQKGLRRGIINVVRFFLGIEIEIHSLYEDGWIIGEDELGETTYLGTNVQALIYSFEIESPIALTDDERDKISQIANYMKPAHTHLIRIIEPTVSPTADHWELGLSEIGVETILH